MSAAEAGASLGSCGGAGVFCYTYDAFGRMVEKNNAGTFTEYLYSPLGLTAIMSGQTANAFRAPIPGGALFTNNGSGSIVSHMDWQGSARLSATLGHSVSRDTSYSPYGEDYGNSGTGVVQFFAGMYSDNDSNVLFDTPNRQFDVSSGSRWLSPDPARASWNAYAYPTNPNSFIDPSGLCPDCENVDARGSAWGGCYAGVDCTTFFTDGMTGRDNPMAEGLVTYLSSIPRYSVVGGQLYWHIGFYTPNPKYDPQTPGSSIGTSTTADFDLGPVSTAANNGSWLQHGLNYLKNHPVFISVNEILAAQITVQWSTKTVCANLGAGASVPPTKAVAVGVYNNGNMSNWTNVLSSWGYSFGANLIAGYQASTNSSGTIGGPTVSGVGLSGSYTYGGCMTVP